MFVWISCATPGKNRNFCHHNFDGVSLGNDDGLICTHLPFYQSIYTSQIFQIYRFDVLVILGVTSAEFRGSWRFRSWHQTSVETCFTSGHCWKQYNSILPFLMHDRHIAWLRVHKTPSRDLSTLVCITLTRRWHLVNLYIASIAPICIYNPGHSGHKLLCMYCSFTVCCSQDQM